MRIALIGDAVTFNQPPYLGGADIPAWIASLELLLTPDYREYLLVSGRGGLAAQKDVREQIAFLQKALQQIETLAQDQLQPRRYRPAGARVIEEFHRRRMGSGRATNSACATGCTIISSAIIYPTPKTSRNNAWIHTYRS